MIKALIAVVLLAGVASGCSAVAPSGSVDLFKLPLREIQLEPDRLLGDVPFCIWGAQVSIDKKQLDPRVLGGRGKRCTAEKIGYGGKFRGTEGGFNFPFWHYKTITVRFKRTPEGEYITYTLPMTGKLEPRPESRLTGLRILITENSVKVERWDIRKNPAKPGIANEFDDHTAIIEMKEFSK